MCKLDRNSEKDQEKGFKIVVKKKDGRYYSAAMGFKYRKDHRVPIVKRQRKLSSWFNDLILEERYENGFSKSMIGRTAIFLSLIRARYTAHSLINGTEDGVVTIVKATVSKDIMLGVYGTASVAAGRRIKFGEEVSIKKEVKKDE